jgi:hypothetical protein
VKCSLCDKGLGPTWFCIAGQMASGTIHVGNLHRECFEREFGRPMLRKMDAMLFRVGWVQEKLPLGI